jgi:hypothetical protein
MAKQINFRENHPFWYRKFRQRSLRFNLKLYSAGLIRPALFYR